MALEDLIAEYQARGLSREEARRAIIRDFQEMAPKGPRPELSPMRPVLEEFAASRRRRQPPSPVEVVERVAEALPQLPVQPPVGATYARILPSGAFDPKGWRPPGITPVGFHRGYWTKLSGDLQVLYRSGQAVNQWDASTVGARTGALAEIAAFVTKWPIQAERSVFTGGRR